MKRLAIITSHPIQYYAPWFRYLAQGTDWTIHVFYLWDFGVTSQVDAGFQQPVQWDISLLDGYEYEFVPNVSRQPGTQHCWGLQNPTLTARVRAFQPDAVLLMNYNYASVYRFLWHWQPEWAPIVFRGDSHCLGGTKTVPNALSSWMRQYWRSLVFRRFAACLYVGQANYTYFIQQGVPSERLVFSPHAIDNDRFLAQSEPAQQAAIAWKRSLGIPADHQVILFAGKFEDKKRPLDLLHAFLQANLAQVSLLFVGAGKLEPDLKAAAAAHAHIYVAPFQNQTLMPRTYAAGDIVVLPSCGNQETWGLSINEAMCLARPVIVSNHVGCAQDLVEPGRNGLIFPAGDVSALAECLRQAFSDRQRLASWGKASQMMIAHYSYRQATHGLLQALELVTEMSEQRSRWKGSENRPLSYTRDGVTHG